MSRITRAPRRTMLLSVLFTGVVGIVLSQPTAAQQNARRNNVRHSGQLAASWQMDGARSASRWWFEG